MESFIISDRDVLRFQKHLVRNEENGCLEWTGCLKSNGYGRIWMYKSNGSKAIITTHRLAWRIANGDIPEGLCVLHYCDNPKCCDPDHLFLGTIQDNNADCRNKGRHKCGRNNGERNGSSKLTEKEVISIRAEWQSGRYNQEQLSQLFGVDQANVSCIVNNKTWKHLK